MRNKRIEIRLSEDEYQKLLKLKTKPRLAEWIRENLLSNDGGVRKVVVKKVDDRLIYELNRIGNNLNQIARYCNLEDKGVDVDKAKILLAVSLISEDIETLLEEVKK